MITDLQDRIVQTILDTFVKGKRDDGRAKAWLGKEDVVDVARQIVHGTPHYLPEVRDSLRRTRLTAMVI